MQKATTEAREAEKRLYDTKGEKVFKFREQTEEGELGELEFSHTFRGFEDAVLKEFDNRRSVRLQTHGKATDVEAALVMAAVGLWDDLAVSVDGYGEEGEPLPENWKELVGAEDKILAVNDLLFVDVAREEARSSGSRRAWVTAQDNVIRLTCLDTNGKIETKHVLRGKTAKDVHDYERIRAAVSIAKKDLIIPPTMTRKAELYDRMITRTEGYVGGIVPLHHKAAVISEYFESSVESLAKK